jgi:class 3 adenylate cyclase/tetratricopeptide (TPR) repeat protein
MAEPGIVTLLFTDLVDSSAHLQNAGDEAGQHLFRVHHKLMTEAVAANGGQELQWLGDGILAAFSSSADAVRCAISVQQTARRPVAGARFEIRIGIHAGEAMRSESGYFGTPVVVARRLCDTAASGQIRCSKLIAELLSSRQSFNFRELGRFELKGIAEPMAVCEVVYERNDPAALLNRTPFVGRAQQVERLSAKLEEACNGKGGFAMLLGEAGIGKTRMIEEFTDLARQRGAIVVRGACYDGEWQPPYGPFAEAIVEYARHAERAELEPLLGKSASALVRMAPALRQLLGNVAEPPALDKEEERFRLLDAVAQFLLAVAQRTPLVLVLDDLHWADRGTVAMLSHVAHFVSGSAILVVGAYRDAEVNSKHPLAGAAAAIKRLPNSERIMLKGLNAEDVGELLGMIADESAPDGLIKAIRGETEGNPFFIREVLMHLMESGKILQEGKGWSSNLSIAELDIPEGVRQLVARRLSRLSAEANLLLTVGAAFNGAFSFEIAAAVAGLEEGVALSAADEALDAQLLRSGAGAEIFEFTHAIIRHTLYAELNPARRTRLHRKIAEAMEGAWGERVAEHAAEVAYQFWRGSAVMGAERGVDYAIAAADNAESAYAYDEVVAFLRIALELLPQGDARRTKLLARLGIGLVRTINREESVSVALEAGELIAAAEGAEAAAEYLENAAFAMHTSGFRRGSWELAKVGLRHAGGRRDFTWASLRELDLLREGSEDPENPGIRTDTPAQRELREVMKTIAPERIATRDFITPRDSRAEIINDPTSTPTSMLFLAGDYRRSLQLWQQEAAEAERQGRIGWAVTAWADVASSHTALGNFAAATAACDRAALLSARIAGSMNMDLMGAMHELRVALDAGWEQVLEDTATNTLIEEPDAENHWAFAFVRACAAYTFARLHQPELALQWLEGIPAALERGAAWEPTYCGMACDSAGALWLLNRTDHVETFERNIREKVIAHDFRYPTRDSRLSLARLYALQSRHEEASEWFAQARATLEEQGARPLRAIADYDEGLMYIRRGAEGDAQRARPWLESALNQFRAIGMTGWIERAGEAISQTGL